MRVGAKTDIGKVREVNEDSYGYHGRLFVLADGMGGHEAGEIASAIAVETVLAADLGDAPTTRLHQAILDANRAILAEVEKHPEHAGMGTTINVLYLDITQAYITNVGDSRIYRLSGGRLKQLTADDSLVAQLVKNGSITEEEAKVHPRRNVLIQALGMEGNLEFEVTTVGIAPGDKFLLCSDGLTGMFDEKTITSYLDADMAPQSIAEQLVGAADEAGGRDNITVIVVEV